MIAPRDREPASRQTRESLIGLVWPLLKLRGSPADLPSEPRLPLLLIGASVLIDVLVAAALNDNTDVFARSLMSSAVVLGLCWIALAMRGLRHRFVQTATALVACSLVFSLLQLPLAWLAGPAPANLDHLTTLQVLIGWITIAMFVWQISIDAHIMRHALDAPFGLAFALVVCWMVAYFAIERIAFGAA